MVMKNQRINVFQKILNDQKVINKCIKQNGNIKEVAKKHNIKIAAPI